MVIPHSRRVGSAGASALALFRRNEVGHDTSFAQRDALLSEEREAGDIASVQRATDIWRRGKGITSPDTAHVCTRMCSIEPITGSYMMYGCVKSGAVHACRPSEKQCPARYYGGEGVVFCVFSKAELFVSASRVVNSYDSVADGLELEDDVNGSGDGGPGHTAMQQTDDGVKGVNAAMFPGPSVMWDVRSHAIIGGGASGPRVPREDTVVADAKGMGSGTKSVSVTGRTMASRRGHGDPSVRRNKKLMSATVVAMGTLMEEGWGDIIDSVVHDILVGVSVRDVDACTGGTLVDMASSAPLPRISKEDLAVAMGVCRFMWKFQVVNRAGYYPSGESGMVPRESVAATLYRLAVGPVAFSVSGSCFVDDFKYDSHKDAIILYPMGCLSCHLPSVGSVSRGEHPWISEKMILRADSIQCDSVACVREKTNKLDVIGDARAEFYLARDRFDVIRDDSYDGKNRNIKFFCDARDASEQKERDSNAPTKEEEDPKKEQQGNQKGSQSRRKRRVRNVKRPLSGGGGAAGTDQTSEQLAILDEIMRGIGPG